MSKTQLRAAALGGTADEIEAAFYEALQRGDIDALMACWADEDEVFCVHPGGPRLVGTAAIRAAFEQMFSNGAIHATPARVRRIDSLASAVHNVLERIEVLTAEGARHAFVLATNVYHKTPQGWRLVAHHASPGSAREPDETLDTPQTLH
ncbi:MAG: DUF4440 domain-containing protein [Variovorax sp.]|nr:MAG: DUF4440 domain-containing protein [Variovorax sp.]